MQYYGPYHASFVAGGPGIEKHLDPNSSLLSANGPWTIVFWFEAKNLNAPGCLLAGIGSPLESDSRYLGLSEGHPLIRFGKEKKIVADTKVEGAGLHQMAATYAEGKVNLYFDGKEVASRPLTFGRIAASLGLAPADLPAGEGLVHFGGELRGVEVIAKAIGAEEIRGRFEQHPSFANEIVEISSHPWPLQIRQQMGRTTPQEYPLLPHGREPAQKPVVQPLPPKQETLRAFGEGQWQIAANWQLAFAKDVKGTAEEISSKQTDSAKWLSATVPGTVLTTLINRGVYPDSDFGLNNMVIPESLARQDYWYRVSFPTPEGAAGRHVTLTFNGINYAAEVWLNGNRVGDIKGAFLRGSFNVTTQLAKSGENLLAVRVSPPPHPGIPDEESLDDGPGQNGGIQCIDGPTFVATEGWDWIPGIRDRNTGIWQDVVLSVSGELRIGDPQVISRLPLPDISTADVEINLPVKNSSASAITATVHASFEGVEVSKEITAAPGKTYVRLSAQEFPALHLMHPRLWWPNGYGKPELYHLKLALDSGGAVSDHKELSFGVREVTYEETLFNRDGELRRVEVSPTEAHYLGLTAEEVTHAGIRETAHGWAASITPEAEGTAAIKSLSNELGLTDLVIKVNGVRIAARGGNWGMDDSRKRVSRAHLEPFFRLHRDANLNIIRNWVGQNSEETFFQLADEYGLMVWNDFWDSTQNYNAEPADAELFLRNARDTVAHFRNHPSIVIWSGRNEGVPQPILNEGLIAIFAELDGTRYYTPNSRDVNLRGSGPYSYEDPSFYYAQDRNHGFSVELGIASFSTLESFQHAIAPADQWPVSDAWAYHDWHQSNGGDVHPWMKKLDEEFDAATSLKDFERKAQVLNYVDHRAIFEGFNQHLWTPNSGRLLWMTQPAWPSNNWQIMNSDYDTSAAYYGVKKACEPIHVQLDLTNYQIALVNTTRSDSGPLQVTVRVYSLDNRELLSKAESVNAKANSTMTMFALDAAPLYAKSEVLLIRLEARDGKGALVSDNFYWLANKDANYRGLNSLKPAKIAAVVAREVSNGESVLRVRLKNEGTVAALEVKLIPKSAKTGERILPVYLSDNYISLLPGEERMVTVASTAGLIDGDAVVGLRGWNLQEFEVAAEK